MPSHHNPLNAVPRFTGAYRLAGTKSFRLGSGKLFGEFGSNTQNSAKQLLPCLVARPGFKFVQADQSGAEALIVANLAKPARYRELFDAGIKPHTFVALQIFGRRKPAWFGDKDPEVFINTLSPTSLARLDGWGGVSKTIAASDGEPDKPYYCGKRTVHARSYRMRWRTFQLAILKDTGGTLVLTPAQAKAFLETFDKLFPEIAEWQLEVVTEARVKGVIHNLLGFPRRCNQIFNDAYERDIISWKPQSTVGCITHEGVIKIDNLRREKNLRWHLVSNKHDSMMWEVPAAEAEDCAVESQKALAVKLVGRDGVEFTMKSEVQIGENWAGWHAEKNPNGMKRFL